MKKIILIIFLSFFISSISNSKIEKTKLGFSIDVPSDFILVSRDNYSEFKTLLIRNFTNVKKEDYDKEVENFYKSFAENQKKKFEYLVIIPNWGNSFVHSQITFNKQDKEKFDKSFIDEVAIDKNKLKEFCEKYFLLRVSELKIDRCNIDNKKFKKFPNTINIKSKVSDKDKIFDVYFVDYKNILLIIELNIHKQDYERINGSLKYMVDTIN